MLPAAVKIDKPREVYCEAGKIELFLSAQLNWKPGTSNGVTWVTSEIQKGMIIRCEETRKATLSTRDEMFKETKSCSGN
jgi:hypothetical protein